VSETTKDAELSAVIAGAAVEIIREGREALNLPEGARLSSAITALATFLRECDALYTDLGGPYDDASFRAIGEELSMAIHKLRAPRSPGSTP
jgi:hypothetical protein